MGGSGDGAGEAAAAAPAPGTWVQALDLTTGQHYYYNEALQVGVYALCMLQPLRHEGAWRRLVTVTGSPPRSIERDGARRAPLPCGVAAVLR